MSAVLPLMTIAAGAWIGLTQLRLTLTRSRPPSLRRVSLCAAGSGLFVAAAGFTRLLSLPRSILISVLIAAALCAFCWFMTVFALSKHNTAM